MSQRPSNGSFTFDPNELRKRKAWDQIAGETDKAYRAFMIYRNLPPEQRSIRAAWNEYSPDKEDSVSSHFAIWASQNHWQERAQAWDNHLQGIKDKASEKVFSQELLAERKNRTEMLENMRKMVAVYMFWANSTAKSPQVLKSVISSAATYLDQSRREFGDDPASERQREEQLQENIESVRQKIQSIMAQAATEAEAGRDSSDI